MFFKNYPEQAKQVLVALIFKFGDKKFKYDDIADIRGELNINRNQFLVLTDNPYIDGVEVLMDNWLTISAKGLALLEGKDD